MYTYASLLLYILELYNLSPSSIIYRPDFSFELEVNVALNSLPTTYTLS